MKRETELQQRFQAAIDSFEDKARMARSKPHGKQAMAQLEEQYLAALKHAESQYFEGVKRVTDAIMARRG